MAMWLLPFQRRDPSVRAGDGGEMGLDLHLGSEKVTVRSLLEWAGATDHWLAQGKPEVCWAGKGERRLHSARSGGATGGPGASWNCPY